MTKFEITRKSRNIHIIDCIGKSKDFLLISDVHWDNPHCDRALLKNHLDEAVKRDALIVINGDLFCCMQGKADPRRGKSDIRPEHNNNKYIDSIINTAVEWFKPYANNIVLIGYGNHETGVLKNAETDIIERFVEKLNTVTNSNVYAGGYGGTLHVNLSEVDGQKSYSFVTHYYHGAGGGGPVTRGVISDQRMLAMSENYDLIWQGHVHELYHHINPVHRYDRISKNISIRHVHQLRTATYKEEWDEGYIGFHVERGRPPKPLGGYWMTLNIRRDNKSDYNRYVDAEFLTCTRYY